MGRAELEAAVLADPDDDARWSVLADWLLADGDPRGTLGALLAQRDEAVDDEGRHAVGAQIAALVSAHPELVPRQTVAARTRHLEAAPNRRRARHRWLRAGVELSWRGGYLVDARVGRPHGEEPTVAALVRELGTHPSARLLQGLTIGPLETTPFEYQGVVGAIATAGWSRLRRLFLADFDSEHSEISWAELGELGAIWSAHPHLQHVVVRGGGFELGELRLPEARSFAVRTGGLTHEAASSVARADWPALERLELWFGDEDYGGHTDLDPLRPLLVGQRLPNLRDLGLMNHMDSDRIAQAIVRAPIARQLRRLDLSLGTLSDHGADTLADHAGSLPQLRELDVSANYVSAEGLARLREAFDHVVGHDQELDQTWFGRHERYVSVSE